MDISAGQLLHLELREHVGKWGWGGDCKSQNTRKSPSLFEMTGKKKKPPEQLQSSKMHKGKKCQGEEGGSRPSHCEVTGGQKKKKWRVLCLIKGLRTSAMGRTSSFKEISLTSSDGSAASGYSGKVHKWFKVPVALSQFTQALD